jgi:ribonuclease H2 subunit C
MLAIQPSSQAKRTTPNILPCSIKHNGPIPIHPRYWSPKNESDNKTSTSYFRGRKLRGRRLRIPEGYKGVVLQKTGKTLATNGSNMAEKLRRMEEGEEEDEMELDEAVEVKTTEEKASFEEVVVWGHEAVPEENDVYVKGVAEWIAFAEAVSCKVRVYRTLHADTMSRFTHMKTQTVR